MHLGLFIKVYFSSLSNSACGDACLTKIGIQGLTVKHSSPYKVQTLSYWFTPTVSKKAGL